VKCSVTPCLGIPWEYEYEGYDLDGVLYLPDFWLPEQQCFIEIKGQGPTQDEQKKCILLALATGKQVYLFYGNGWISGRDDTYLENPYGETGPEVTRKKGAYGYDPKAASLTVNDTASPCYHRSVNEQCIHEARGEACPAHLEVFSPGTEEDEQYGDIHLAPDRSHLIRAIYTADVLYSLGDSCKLRLDTRGQLQYLVPTYRREPGLKGNRYHFTGRNSVPLPATIQQHKREFEQLLACRPHTFEWGVGAIDGILFTEDIYRWRACPVCKKYRITCGADPRMFPCYRRHVDEGEYFPYDLYDSSIETDETPELVAAYIAARQARFELSR